MPRILVTGGAGYIGSHTVIALLESGYEVVVVDNLSNSKYEVLNRIQMITNKQIYFYRMDVQNEEQLKDLFSEVNIDAVMHFAGKKCVSESHTIPTEYYLENLVGTINLLKCMANAGVKKIVFSSSATVYGDLAKVPYVEDDSKGNLTSPYARTKSMVEDILKDIVMSDSQWKAISLRYFNPIGAHYSGMIGEDPKGHPNNLLPFISGVAIGKYSKLKIFGNDFDTPDGTCRRDYIHVMDIAEGHISALQFLSNGFHVVNLGTGIPFSVLEIVNAFQEVTGVNVPYEFAGRRNGDLPEFWANSEKAAKLLGWKSKRTLVQMLQDTWRWQNKNPNGY